MSAEWDCEYCGHSNLGSSCPCGRPNESDELKDQLSHLQKLCEEQKAEILRLATINHDLTTDLVEQERELDHFKKSGIVEVAVRNPAVHEYCRHWEGRTKKAEAKVEEQKGEIEAFQKSSTWYAYKTVVDENVALKSQLAEKEKEIELLRRMTQNDIVQQLMAAQNQLATQTEQSYMKVWHDCNGKPRPYPNVLCSCHPGNVQMREFDPLKELATQTERVRQAEALLRSAHRWLPDNLMTLSGEPNTKERIYAFLKQESLGDGGKNA